MAARAVWEYCGDPLPGQSAALVQFSNGKLKDPENMDFALYKNKDNSNPRKKNQRIVAAETDRLCYVGNNFGPGSLKCNSLCRYFVGVLDKKCGKMQVYNSELYNMQPVFPDDLDSSEGASENTSRSYREKVDFLIEAFGTNKQKRALNSRKMNQVGSETLNKAVVKAAENIIEAKGVTALVSDAVQNDSQDVSLFLPPCHADVDKPENVYKFDDLISPAEYAALEAPSAAFRDITAEEIKALVENGSHGSFVIEELQSLPHDEKCRDHKARCLWFLDVLIKFSFQKLIKKKHPVVPECPYIINDQLIKNFTAQNYVNGRLKNLLSTSMKAKITAYVIALALHISDFQIDLTVLQRDMKLTESRMLEIARAMGLKISKKKLPVKTLGEENHKMGTLVLPLIVYAQPSGQRKRRKMT
ncbi:DNA-directed RNA polymerase I subunit RPA49 [Microcaecilia unicolor]|uniref:DNA-directed RNA polymerase I subunit RPA49 n=1 Tax=Microcaecilia unicolor TaxID=1415580 RepID=A0A6P7XHY3_9AMPH|nr:DNA-directed RNA polymerase I subunit RPA49 [Microcaecilia unicolor]